MVQQVETQEGQTHTPPVATRELLARAVRYMRQMLGAASEEAGHSERVLYTALHIAAAQGAANATVVALAAILHDVGRALPKGTPPRKHAARGARAAGAFLRAQGCLPRLAAQVAACIATHSQSGTQPPRTLEAQIVYDADKLDLTGALGTARMAGLCAEKGLPLYTLDAGGRPAPGKKAEGPSLLRQYRRRLKKLPTRLYTEEGRRIAAERLAFTHAYFEALHAEATALYSEGHALLHTLFGP